MDDQMNQSQGMPGNPVQDSGIGMQSPVFQTPSGGAGDASGAMGEMGGSMGGMTPPPDEHPHEQILAALARIEEKLAAIAAKVGA